jgi:hypothetical protein
MPDHAFGPTAHLFLKNLKTNLSTHHDDEKMDWMCQDTSIRSGGGPSDK